MAGAAARNLAAEVLRLLRAANWTVATAESLTGGLVAAALTDIPGASQAFRGGVVSYATDLKASLLGVDAGHARGPRRGVRASRRGDGRRGAGPAGRDGWQWPPRGSRGRTRRTVSRQERYISR